MKILKYLLNYISLFMIVLVVFSLVYFRTEIFPENINKPIDSSIAVIEDKFDIEIPSYQADDSIVEESSEEVVKANDNLLIKTVEDPVVEVIHKTEKFTKVTPQQNIETKLVSIVEEDAIDQNGLVVTEKSSKQDDVITISNIDANLYQARQAYWKGDIKTAEKIYKELTVKGSSNANVYGELGNVYYLQGKWKEAGDAYYEAAIRLIDKKQYAQVNYLLRVIQGLNPNVAKKLQKKMFG